MITLRLRGSLATCVREHLDDEALGRCGPDEAIVELEARTVAEALSLVGPQAPGFALRWDLGSWRVSVDGRALESAAGLWMRLANRAYVSISPVLAGSGPAWAALPLWAKIVAGVSTVYSVVHAVTQIPSIPDTEHLAEEGQRRTLFSGPVNTVAQGGAVPLIYGRTRVGSTVISGGLSPDRPTGGEYTSPPVIDLGGNAAEGRPDPAEDPRHGITRDVPAPGEASRSRSTLRVVDLLGEGEIEGLADGLESVFIDGVPVETDGELNVKGVSVQERRGLAHGHAEQGALAGFDVTATGLPRSSTKVAHGTPVSQRVPQGYDAARVTLVFPRLVQYDENNRALKTEVEVRIETRPTGQMSWTTVLLQTIRDRSLDRQELSWRVDRPGSVRAKGTWEIRVSRETTDSEPDEASDEVRWERTFGLRDVKQSYPHSAVVGLTMDLSQSEVNPSRREYEVRGRKVMAPLPSMWDPDKPTSESAATYGEGMWDGRLAPRWTNNPAWIAYDLLTDHRGGLGGVPGMAAAAYAARWEFFELARRCDELVPSPESESAMEPRWRFNGVIERREQARKVVDWVLSACRAGALWSSGHASLAVDGDSDVTAALANANVIDGEFEYQGLRWQERYSAVAVTWRDPDDDFRSGIELVVFDDLVAKYGFRQKDVAAVGCTSRGQAHRTGLLLLNEQENESETVKFGMALEGMHLRPGDRVRIADDRRFEQRAGFRIREVDTSVAGQETLTLDTPAPRLAAGGRIVWGEGRSAEVSAAAETLEHEIALGAATAVTSTSADWSFRNDRLPASLGGGNVDRVILYRQGANWTAYVGASLDAGAAWERFAGAVQVAHPTAGTLVLAGPDHPSSAYRDASPPYNWFVGSDDGNEMQTWLAAYEALPAADRGGVTLRLVQPAPVNLQSPRLTTTDVPTGLGVGDLVAEESAVTDWIVTQLTERDKAEVQVEARRHDPEKYKAVEKRRELAPPLRTPVAPMAPPTAVTVAETTYRDRNLVRSQLEIAVRGGDHDSRIARVEYQIRRPKRRATAAEIEAGDWSVLPRGPWQPLRTTPARSIVVRDVALGGYRVRARFLGGRRESDWTRSAHVVADGKTDAGTAPTGLAAEPAIGGYWAHWNPSPDGDYAHTEIYDRAGTPGSPAADVDVSGDNWTLRGKIAGTGLTRADVSGTEALRVAIRHVDTSGLSTEAREVGVEPLEGVSGADGEDGIGYEYVFAAYSEGTLPNAKRPSNNWGYERQGTVDGLTWHDGAPDLTSNTPVLLRAERKLVGTPSPGDAIADDWSVPAVVGRYGEDGVPGADGEDGRGYEYVFAAYADETVPASKRPLNSWGYERQGTVDGLTWHDGAPGLTADAPVLLRAERRLVGTPSPGDTVADDWSVPAVVGRYGDNAGAAALDFAATANASQAQMTWRVPTTDAPDNWRVQFGLPDSTGIINWGTASFLSGSATDHTLTTSALASIVGKRLHARIQAARSTGDGAYILGGAVEDDTVVAGTTLVSPTGGTATAGAGQVALDWNDVANATGYDVERQQSGGRWQRLATGRASSSYTDTGVSNGTSYRYRVRATAGSTVGSWWTSSFVTPNVATSGPGAPRNLSLAADGQNAADGDWDPPTSWGTGSSRTYRYELRQGTTVVSSGTTGTSSRRFTGLSAATSYALKVRCETTHGNSSYVSDSATTAAAPPPPPPPKSWGSWSSTWSKVSDPIEDDFDDASGLAFGRFNSNTESAMPNQPSSGFFMVHQTQISGTSVDLLVAQSIPTTGNNMRNQATDTWIGTNTSYLNQSGLDLNDYRTSSFNFNSALQWFASLSNRPSGAPGTDRGIAFLTWRRDSDDPESGTQTLRVVTSSGIYRKTRRYE